jgi:CheY-like chemotaxis protein
MRGYHVTVAGDGEEACRYALSEPFDLCLMDVDMPTRDGLEATRLIRAKTPQGSTANHLPIVAMTAHSGDQIRGECEAAGMDDYLCKPIDPDRLFETIDRLTQISCEA